MCMITDEQSIIKYMKVNSHESFFFLFTTTMNTQNLHKVNVHMRGT